MALSTFSKVFKVLGIGIFATAIGTGLVSYNRKSTTFLGIGSMLIVIGVLSITVNIYAGVKLFQKKFGPVEHYPPPFTGTVTTPVSTNPVISSSTVHHKDDSGHSSGSKNNLGFQAESSSSSSSSNSDSNSSISEVSSDSSSSVPTSQIYSQTHT